MKHFSEAGVEMIRCSASGLFNVSKSGKVTKLEPASTSTDPHEAYRDAVKKAPLGRNAREILDRTQVRITDWRGDVKII